MNSKAEHGKQWIQPHLLIQFSSEAYERMAYILNMKKLTVNKEETPSRTEHHKDPNKCRKTSDLSLAKI